MPGRARYDWSSVDWAKTNREIAADLGGVALETVARRRTALGHPTVWPETPAQRLARAEEEIASLREQRREACAAIVRDAQAGSYTRAVMSEILGRRIEEGERNEDAARRVVRERDEARAEAEQLRAERDRFACILAVERGDESQAPEGWRRSSPGAWFHATLRGRCGGPEVILRRYQGDDDGDGDLPARWERSPRDDGPRESWPTALEAMLAISAEHAQRDEARP